MRPVLKLLETYREYRGKTRADLYRGAGISRSTYLIIRAGQRNISLDILIKIARYLEIPPEALAEALIMEMNYKETK